MRRRAPLAAFTALVAEAGAVGVRLVTAGAAPIISSHPGALRGHARQAHAARPARGESFS